MTATRIMGGEIINSIIAEGAIINKAKIVNSVIRKGVVIEDGVEVRDSIIMDSVVLKKGCKIKKSIIDSYNVIKKNIRIGFKSKEPYWRASMDPSGISVVASEKPDSQIVKNR